MDKLATNSSRGVPTDDEITLVRQVFIHPLSKLEGIDKAQAELKAAMEKLEEDKKALKQYFAVYLNIISPMSRLPEDILREIFIWCLPHDRPPTMSNTEAPMLLTQVTGRWREIALTTPRLWASIYIVIPSTATVFDYVYNPATGSRLTPLQVAEMRAAGVSDWLGRSGSMPLEISIHEQDVYPRSEYAHHIISVLLPHAKRWRQLKFDGPVSSIAEIKELLPKDTPILHRLDIRPRRDQPVSQSNWGNGALFGSRSLRDLSLLGMQGVERLPVPWNLLTNLVIDAEWWNVRETITMIGAVQLLAGCTNLKTCKLKLNVDDAIVTQDPVYLPNLESLYILEAGRNITLATYFNAPNLKIFEYQTNCSRKEPEKVHKFLSTPAMELEELSLTPRLCGGSMVNDWLGNCPGLKSLTIRPSATGGAIEHGDTTPTEVSDVLLAKLTGLKDECLCPDLETLTANWDAFFSEEAVIDFVKCKMSEQYPHLAKLKSLTVAFRHLPPNGDRDFVKNALADIATPESGLKLDIQYPPPTYRGPFSLFEGIPKQNREHPYYQHLLT